MRKTPFGVQVPTEGDLVRGLEHTHGVAHHERQVGPVGERGADSDHLLNALRPPLREDLGEQAASAVADDAHPRPSLGLHLDQAVAEAGQHSLRVLDVEEDAREVRLVADPVEPALKNAHRPVAREETWNQQDRPPVAMGHPSAAKHVIPKQR